MAKTKLALYRAGACCGYDGAVLDEAMPDESIDVCLFNGCVRSSAAREYS